MARQKENSNDPVYVETVDGTNVGVNEGTIKGTTEGTTANTSKPSEE